MSGGFRSRSKSGDSADRGKKERGTTGQRGGQQSRGQHSGKKGGRPHGGRGQRAHAGSRPRGNNRNTDRAQADSLIQSARRSGVDVPRAVAFDVLRRVDADDAFANLTLPKALSTNKVNGRDAAFATELTYGTLRTEGVLDAVIAECASRGLDAMAPEVLTALRLGTYQVLYTLSLIHI